MQRDLLSCPVHLVPHAIGDMHRLLVGNLHQVGPLKIKSCELLRHHRIVLHGLPQFFRTRNLRPESPNTDRPGGPGATRMKEEYARFADTDGSGSFKPDRLTSEMHTTTRSWLLPGKLPGNSCSRRKTAAPPGTWSPAVFRLRPAMTMANHTDAGVFQVFLNGISDFKLGGRKRALATP